MKRDLLSMTDRSQKEVEKLLYDAARLKKSPFKPNALQGKTIALIFEKPSTRTLVSFAAGIQALGGSPLVLQSDALQWKRGETIPDMARVMTRYLHSPLTPAPQHKPSQKFPH